MLAVIKYIYGFFLLSLLLIMLFSFSGCSNGGQINLPPEICEYGNIFCSVSNTLCEQNNLPENICYYFNMTCLNLEYLCSDTLTTETKQVLLKYQKALNDSLINSVLNYAN